MYLVIISSLIALLLTYFESYYKLKGMMKIGFIIITILGAIHYNYGSDYMEYYYIYDRIKDEPFNLEYIMSGLLFRDPGWIILCYIFKPLGGFFTMVAVLTIVQNTVIYNFIRREVKREWWPLAVFIFLFHSSFFLLSFSMLRQWFVMCVFLALFPLIRARKVLFPLLIIILCSFIHGASVILVPIVFVGYLNKLNGKVLAFVMLLFLLSAWLSKDFLEGILNQVSQLEEVEGYIDAYGDRGFSSLGVGYLIQSIPLVLYLFYIYSTREIDSDNRLLVILASFGFLIAPFGQTVSLIVRVAYFFDLFSIAAIPIAYKMVNKELRFTLITLFILLELYNYFTFFSNPLWIKSYSDFHTIFSAF